MSTYYHISKRFRTDKNSPGLFIWPDCNIENKCDNIEKAKNIYHNFVIDEGNSFKLIQIHVKHSKIRSHKTLLASYS